MDKASSIIILLVLQLLVTFTSTAHHETKDLGAAASNFFGGLNTKNEVKETDNAVDEADDHEHSEEEDASLSDDFVNVDMDEEDTEDGDQADESLDLFEDDDEIDLMDMDLEKHLKMHQRQDVHEPLFPHLASGSENDSINDEVEDGMPSKMMDVGMGSKIKHHQIVHKMHAPQYPTYTTPTYGQEYAPYPNYDSNPTYGQEQNQYPTYDTNPTYYQKLDQYPTYETTPTYSQGHNQYPTNHGVRYVPIMYVKKGQQGTQSKYYQKLKY